MIPSTTYHRYQRQIALEQFGFAAQEKLFGANVLIVGAGGLGCPALQYLAAAGVGTIGIIDFDVIERTNLQRQTLYSVADIGKLKAETAAQKLKDFNPDIQFNVYTVKLDSKNALDILREYDVVVDGTDNFATRYLVNDACVLLDKVLVYGAVLRFEGQVGVFNLEDPKATYKTHYRDLFPEPPDPASVLSCSEAGVLGVLPGIIGTMQAAEVIKIITGIGAPLSNKIVSYNVLTNFFYEFSLTPATKIDVSFPQNEEEFSKFDYDWFCGAPGKPDELTSAAFDTLRTLEETDIIDVREEGELPVVDEFIFTQIPFSTFEEAINDLSIINKVVIICQTGKRSLVAANLLKKKFPATTVFSLKGGIEEWKKYQLKTSPEPNQISQHEAEESSKSIY